MGNPAVNGSPVGANDNQQLTPFQTYLSNERLAGKNWDAIHADMAARIEAAHNVGHTDEEIARSMDLSTDAYEQARANAGIAHAVVNPTRSQYGGTIPDTAGPLNFFQAGVKGSSGGEVGVTIAGQNPSETQWSPSDHAGIVNTTAYMAGQIIGDTPAMLAGAGVATLAAPETAGASLAGAFALPGMMKKTYALNLQNGTIKDPVDFVSRVGAVSIEGAEQGGIGIATAGAGSSVGAMLDQAGVKGFGKWITKNAAEYLTMTAGQAVASGQLPSREQLLDGALLLAVVHLGGKLTPHAGVAGRRVHALIGSGTGEEAEVTPGLVNTTQTNLLEAFADHGIAVPDAVKAGVQDPVVRQGLQTPRDGPRHVAPGSSQTGPIYDHEPNSAPTMTVSRPPNNFEAATSFIFKEEGGYTIDANGAGVNMGINQADHPEVDVKHLTRQEAADIYYKDYWEPMGIDKLPDNMKLPVYDAAIVEGIPKARQMLEESGNDPVRFSELRLEHYRSLARDNPAKYGRYLKTWEARTQRTMGGVKLSDGVDLARELNSGEPASSPDMDRWVEDDPDETRDTPGFLSRFAQAEEGSVSMDREADRARFLEEDRITDRLPPHMAEQDLPTHTEGGGPAGNIDMTTVPHLKAQLPGQEDTLYHGTSVNNGIGVMLDAERGMGRTNQIYTSPNKDLALGQSGKGMIVEFDPSKVQGSVPSSVANDVVRGTQASIAEAIIEKTTRGSVKGFTVKGAADLEKLRAIPKIEGRFDFEHAQTLPDGSIHVDRYTTDQRSAVLQARDLAKRFAESESGAGPGFDRARKDDHRDDNNRDFIERVNNATADPTKPDGIVKTTQVWAHKLYQELFNPNDPLGRLVRDVRRGGGTIDDANNPLLLQRMAETSPNYVMKAISEKGDMVNLKGDKVGPSMGKILAPFGKEDPKGINFWGYYSARWAADLMQRGMKTPMDPQDVLDYLQAGHAKYGDAFNQMVELNNQSLHWLVEGDIKTQAEYNAAVAANRAYMPAQRVREGVEPMRGPATGRTVFDPMWRLKGSELQLLNPQEAIIKNLFLRHSLASHNLVVKAAADAATKYGFARDEGTVKGVSPPLNADELSKDGLNPDLEQRMTDLMGDHVKGDEVPVFRDGMMHKVLFHDPELRTMLHGLDDLQLKFWDKLMAIPAKVQRTSIVTSPSFPIHILQYDLVFQQLTKTGQNTIAQAYLGTKNVFGHTPLWDEWERKGAPDRVLDGYTKSKFVQDVLKDRSDPTIMDNVFNAVGWAPKQAWRALRAWGMMTSQIMPVGRYAMLKARGNVSQEQMAWQASEAPFHRSGFGGVVGKRLNSGMPFTTAWLNGLEKMSRAAIGHPRPGEERLDAQGKPIEWDTKALASFYAKGLGITAVVLSNAMLNHNQLWYQAEPKWVKDNSLFLIHLGGDWEATGKTDPRTGAPIYIPHGITIPWRLPPIASTLFGAIPRRLAEQFVYDNPHAWDDFAADAAAGFTPPSAMIPSMIQPVIEQLTNYSIHGNHSLVPDAAQRDLDTPEQYTPYTTSTAKMIAGAINAMPGINMLPLGPNMRPGASPIIVDNYINEIGAGGVSEITHAIDNIGSAMGITGGHAAARSWDDDVIAHSLAERYPGFSADPIKAFDARYATFMHTRGALAQAIQNDDYDTFVRKIQENPDLAGLAAPHAARNAAPPPDIDQFVGAIQGARHGIDPNGPAMMWFKTARAIKDTERRYDIIDSLPTHPSADHPNSPWETPIEKRQQLDSMQATLMVMAMRSNHWADQAGIK